MNWHHLIAAAIAGLVLALVGFNYLVLLIVMVMMSMTAIPDDWYLIDVVMAVTFLQLGFLLGVLTVAYWSVPWPRVRSK